MKLSLYTCVKNGLFYDYHVVDMIKHHLPLFDEIIIYDGNSTDGTAEVLRDIDSKVKLFSGDWGSPTHQDWFADFKNEARQRCTGDWCVLLDPDEFIPEWEFERFRETMAKSDYPIIRLDWIHFYGNYKVYNARPEKKRWAVYKYQAHRNVADFEVWGDGSNVGPKSKDYTGLVSPEQFVCHHFGMVRYPSRLRQKLRVVHGAKSAIRRWIPIPSFVFNLLPYDWFDKDFLDDLEIYDGKLIETVRRNPKEFTRDNLRLYRYLTRAKGAS
jgi:glycosyltransferase involved in cell wall biosynthesis